MTVIDLGEHRDLPVPTAPRPGRIVRRWGAPLVALLCLLTPAAAAPWPTRPPGATVPAGPRAQVLPVGDMLLVVDDPESGAGPAPRLAAYRLPTGRPLWRVPLPGPGRAFEGARIGDLVVFAVMTESRSPNQVVGLSAADGAVRWRVEGHLAGVTAAGHLLTWDTDASRASALRSHDPAGGAVRWSQRLAMEDVYVARRELRVPLFVVLAGRRLELRDPDTGATLRATALPAAAGRPKVLTVTTDLVLLVDGRGALTGYEIATLRRRWSLPPGPADQPDATDCGVLICVDDGSPATRMLDPATGDTRWRADIGPLLGPVGDRMLAVRGASGNPPEHVLLDAATGRPVRNLGRWQVGNGGMFWNDVTTLSRRQRDGRVVVARIGEGGDGVRVLATLPGVTGGCGALDGFVLCRREDGALGVWTLPDDR